MQVPNGDTTPPEQRPSDFSQQQLVGVDQLLEWWTSCCNNDVNNFVSSTPLHNVDIACDMC
jgi:hypothetical protein